LAMIVVPKTFDEITPTAAKHKQMSTVQVALERLLHQQRQALIALPHVGMAGCQPHPRSARQRNHGRSSAATRRATAPASIMASTIKRRPFDKPIPTRPLTDAAWITGAVSGITTAGTNADSSVPVTNGTA